jgi:hypothetical protein
MTKNSKPAGRAHCVRNYIDKDGITERSHWTDIGSVWQHADSKGYDVTLFALAGCHPLRRAEGRQAGRA